MKTLQAMSLVLFQPLVNAGVGVEVGPPKEYVGGPK